MNKHNHISMNLPFCSRGSLAAVLLLAVTLVSCRGQLSDKPPVQPQQNMFYQERFNAQQENPFFDDNRAMRMPVEGTVARGELRDNIELYEGITEGGGDFVEENPMEITEELLYRGQDRYDIFCSMCHGGTGDGRGIIMEGQYGYVPAPSFHEQRIREQPDGEIYSAIYEGVRTMPSYKTQIPVEDRWAIVAYVRALQQSQNVEEEIVREYGIDIAALQEAYIREQEALAEREELAAVDDDGDISVERGEQLFTRQGCQACHSVDGTDGVGPSLLGLYGSEREIDDGTTATADEDYLYESLVEPGERVTAGYANVMPAFGHLSDDEIYSLIEYIKSLEDE